LNARQLTGRDRGHLVALEEPRCILHKAAVRPFLAMRDAAAGAGFDLIPVSSFRDFERQRAIWNAKFRGERPALDKAGRRVNMAALAPGARVETILLWSALPGMSRHHWGSELDVIDRMAAGYTPGSSSTNTGAAALSRTLGLAGREHAASVSTGPIRAAAAACSRSPGTCPTRRSRGLRSRR
jgi:LAS superfamily LD-carboxypeptidase LdcB